MDVNPSSNKKSNAGILAAAAGIAVLVCCCGVAGVLILGNFQFIQNRLANRPTASQPPYPTQPGAQPLPSGAATAPINSTSSPPATPSTSTNPATIVLWTTTLSDTLNKQIAAYQQSNPNVTISVTLVTQKDIVNLSKTGETEGITPDLMLADNSDLWRLVKAKAVQSLEAVPQASLTGFTRNALNGMTINGKLYGIPVSFELAGLYYNTSMIDTPPTTTDELSLLYRTGTKFGLVKSPYYMMGWFLGFGGEIADRNGRCISTQTGFEDALNLMRQVRKYNSYLVDDPTFIREKFKAEQIGMILDTSSMLPVYAQALEDRLASVPIPGVVQPAVPPMPAEVKPASPILQETGFYLNPKSQNLKVATDLALALSNAQAQTAYMGDYWVPTRSDVKVTDPAIKGFVSGAQNGYPIPQAAWFNNWEGPFQEMIDEELRDQFTVFDAVRLACQKMDALNNK